MNNKTYDILKWVALIVLPALGTLYFALAQIWGLPYGEQIVGTITALDAFRCEGDRAGAQRNMVQGNLWIQNRLVLEQIPQLTRQVLPVYLLAAGCLFLSLALCCY